jgi:hypothetical protein
VDVLKPRWTEASFLLYTGGLTVLGSAVGSLVYLSRSYGDGALVLWTLLILVVLYAIAHGFRIRDRWIAAGVFAFEGFSLARLSFVLLVLAACIDDRRRFRFPLISAITVIAVWYLVTDLISGGGNWTTWVTLIVGLIFLAAAAAMDSPSSFWWNLGAGVLVGAALLNWWHEDDLDYALISVFALLFVAIAYGTRRSSWAILATIGFFLAGYHFAKEWSTGTVSVTGVTNVRDWVPYAVFAFVGFLLVALGLKKRGAAAGDPERLERADRPRYD